MFCIRTVQRGIDPLVTVSNDNDPEALLEGMLQAIVCDELVGWRTESRKLILVFTDELYHVAGDGKVSVCPVTSTYFVLL